jgi:hypothetical protein
MPKFGDTDLSNKDRTAKKWLFRQLANGTLTVLLRPKFDNPDNKPTFRAMQNKNKTRLTRIL